MLGLLLQGGVAALPGANGHAVMHLQPEYLGGQSRLLDCPSLCDGADSFSVINKGNPVLTCQKLYLLDLHHVGQ